MLRFFLLLLHAATSRTQSGEKRKCAVALHGTQTHDGYNGVWQFRFGFRREKYTVLKLRVDESNHRYVHRTFLC